MSDTKAGFNHWLLTGPLVALFGFISYYALFAKWPITRDLPWVNLPLVWGGAALTLWGVKRAVARGGALRLAGAALGTLLALASAGVLTWYVFSLSYQMPAVTAKSDAGATLPALTLTAHDGTAVSLAEASQGTLVLAFYRGAW